MDSASEVEDDVATPLESFDPIFGTPNALVRALDQDLDSLRRSFHRATSSRTIALGNGLDSHGWYALQALSAETGVWAKREGLAKEYHEIKKTLMEEHDELPFRDLGGTKGLDPVMTACTGPKPYRYPRLLQDQSAIRLVVLLPSLERHADIVCELCNSALTKLVSDGYDALSYVWGDPTRRRPIIVGRQVFQATENLEMALRSLRDRTKPQVFWIDAICINQNNVAERNEQVQMMGHIYRCARRVVVWLGPESDTSGATFQLIRNKPEIPDFSKATRKQIRAFWAAFRPGISGFLRLVARPWFRRVWCIQELALARAVDFQCGQHCASMNDFLWMETMFCNKELAPAIHAVVRIDLGGRGASLAERLSFLMKLTSLHRSLILTGVPGRPLDLHASISILNLLDKFQDWLCSNDKDRVFAFYGLVPPGSPDRDALHPNYSLSVAQVYIRFAVRHLQQHRDLRILLTATRPLPGFIDRNDSRELPSWVPDWRDAPSHGRCRLYRTIGISSHDTIMTSHITKYDSMYDACFGLQAVPLKFRNDFTTLSLGGVAVDKIEEIGPVFLGQDSPLAQALQVLSAWKEIVVPYAERRYPYTGQPGREAFWRTLQMDDQLIDLINVPTDDNTARSSQDRQDQEFGQRVRIPRETEGFPPAEQDEAQHLEAPACMMGPMVGRRFFKTAKGLFGLGPAGSRVADDVAVLFGGRAPFVLRPVGESHRLVGEW